MCRQQDRLLDSGVLYRDRRDAGRVLAELLAVYRGRDVLVLGIPRGGVVVAAEVARRLLAELDVIVARRLVTPRAPEIALGAVTASGGLVLNKEIIGSLAIPDVLVDAAVAAQMDGARRREERYRGAQPDPIVRGRTVVLVDDGIATGATMIAAARSVRRQRPARLVAAVPVGSREACLQLVGEVDEIVCPYVPEPFYSVGAFYERFESAHDALLERILRESRAGGRAACAGGGTRPRPAAPEAS